MKSQSTAVVLAVLTALVVCAVTAVSAVGGGGRTAAAAKAGGEASTHSHAELLDYVESSVPCTYAYAAPHPQLICV